MTKKQKNLKNSGQVLIEYAIMLALCAFIAIMLMLLFSVFSDYGNDMLNYIGVDYP